MLYRSYYIAAMTWCNDVSRHLGISNKLLWLVITIKVYLLFAMCKRGSNYFKTTFNARINVVKYNNYNMILLGHDDHIVNTRILYVKDIMWSALSTCKLFYQTCVMRLVNCASRYAVIIIFFSKLINDFIYYGSFYGTRVLLCLITTENIFFS